MEKGLVLQERDVELLEFLAEYKTITLDNDRNVPTQDSRRYLGLLTFDQNFYTVYSVYGEKDNKYITSLYYDLKKEREFYNSIIFTNDIEKILYYKKRIWF